MTPHNVDPKRFQHLLGNGLSADGVMRFFKESKAALLRAGVKVGNLPPDSAAGRRVIMGFNAKAHDVLGKWISQNLAVPPARAPEELITRFRSAESGGVELTAEERKEFGKAGLLELYADEPNPEWLEFLRTSIGTQGARSLPPVAADEWVALASWWLGCGARPTGSNSIAAAVATIRDAVDRKDGQLIDDAAALTEAAADLKQLIRTASHSEAAESVQRGIAAAGPLERAYDSRIDYAAFVVIATNRSARSTEPFFVLAEAFIDDVGEVFSLSPDELRQAIPSDARIVLHADRGFPVAPAIGEAFAYGVERFKTEMPVKVKALESIPDRLLRVIHVPVTSREAHKIRDHIVEYARTPTARAALFVTLDKVCLRPKADSIQRVLAPDFDWQLEQWDSLRAIELANGTYVVAPLPQTTKGFDCSPLSRGARRLVKAFAQRSEVKMQKVQRDLLQELLGSEQLKLDDSTRERLLANIEAIDRGSRDFELLIDELMQSSVIKLDIEKKVNEKVEALELERAKELQSIEHLKREKESIERRIERLRDEADKKSKAVRAAIQKAFANASARELESLGQVAVFEALLARSSETHASTHEAIERAADSVSTSSISPSKLSVSDVLQQLGVKTDVARRAQRALLMGVDLGLPIVCSGIGAGYVSTIIAASLCHSKCIVADVPIGLIRPINVIDILGASGADGLLFQNANLSDLGVYAPELLSLVFQRAAGKRGEHKREVLLFASASGPAALPLPDEVTQLAIKLNVAALETTLESEGVATPVVTGNPLWRRLRVKCEVMEETQPDAQAAFVDLQRLVLVDPVDVGVSNSA